MFLYKFLVEVSCMSITSITCQKPFLAITLLLEEIIISTKNLPSPVNKRRFTSKKWVQRGVLWPRCRWPGHWNIVVSPIFSHESHNVASNKSYMPKQCIRAFRRSGSPWPTLNSACDSGQEFFVEIAISLQIRELRSKIGFGLSLPCLRYKILVSVLVGFRKKCSVGFSF